ITLTPAASSKAGSAYLAAPINLRKGFVCEFSFRMLRDRGDGIAFLVQGQSDAAIGLHGYGLGYSGIERCLALEFDSYRNPDTADPADYHVSLHLPRPGKPKTTSHHEHSV
ncbi:concanavalin A-like lectin/glucanase domain-containing protein, partial [Hyaloraphidium curvatum]